MVIGENGGFLFSHVHYLFLPVSATSLWSEISGPRIGILELKMPSFFALMSSPSAFRSYLFTWVFILILDLALSLPDCLSSPFPIFPMFFFSIFYGIVVGNRWAERSGSQEDATGHSQHCQSPGDRKQVKAMDLPHCSSCSEGERSMDNHPSQVHTLL